MSIKAVGGTFLALFFLCCLCGPSSSSSSKPMPLVLLCYTKVEGEGQHLHDIQASVHLLELADHYFEIVRVDRAAYSCAHYITRWIAVCGASLPASVTRKIRCWYRLPAVLCISKSEATRVSPRDQEGKREEGRWYPSQRSTRR